MSSHHAKVWATLLTKSSYLPGCLVLDLSLRNVQSAYPLIVLATPSLPIEARNVLKARNIKIREIEYLKPEGEHKHTLNDHDKRFEDTWTKLKVFELAEFSRVVLLDCDMLVRKNMDELMTLELSEDSIAAVHACTCNPRKLAHYPKHWVPDNCGFSHYKDGKPPKYEDDPSKNFNLLNSGLVVLTPSTETFNSMKQFLDTSPLIPTFSFPDQDFLAHFFKGKVHSLPYVYNALKTLRSCHKNLWRDDEVKNIHYILDKPWEERPKIGEENEYLHVLWWNEFDELQAAWGSKPEWEEVVSIVGEDKLNRPFTL